MSNQLLTRKECKVIFIIQFTLMLIIVLSETVRRDGIPAGQKMLETSLKCAIYSNSLLLAHHQLQNALPWSRPFRNKGILLAVMD